MVAVAAGAGLWRTLPRLHQPEHGIPTATVKRGRLDKKVYTDGELHARRSVMVVAPSVSGNLRIVRLAPTGTHVHNGDVVVEFDPSAEQYNLEENRFDLEEAEQRKYELGASQIFFVLDAQTQLAQAELSVVQAEIGYQQAVAGVEHATGTLLENHKVKIEDVAP